MEERKIVDIMAHTIFDYHQLLKIKSSNTLFLRHQNYIHAEEKSNFIFIEFIDGLFYF